MKTCEYLHREEIPDSRLICSIGQNKIKYSRLLKAAMGHSDKKKNIINNKSEVLNSK